MSCRCKNYKNMDRYRNTRKLQKQRYRERTGSGMYSPRKWEAWEDELVTAHEQTDAELAKLLGRSVQAVQMRRHRLTERGTQWQST